MAGLALIALGWWTLGLAVVSLFLTGIRKSDSPPVYRAMRARRLSTLRMLVTEAWIWPVYAVGLYAQRVLRRGRS